MLINWICIVVEPVAGTSKTYLATGMCIVAQTPVVLLIILIMQFILFTKKRTKCVFYSMVRHVMIRYNWIAYVPNLSVGDNTVNKLLLRHDLPALRMRWWWRWRLDATCHHGRRTAWRPGLPRPGTTWTRVDCPCRCRTCGRRTWCTRIPCTPG